MDAPVVNQINKAAAVAVGTGLVVGGVASWVAPDTSFLAVSTQVAVQTMLPVYFLTDMAKEQVAGISGGLMAVACYGLHRMSLEACLKYGLLTGAVTYAFHSFFDNPTNTIIKR